MISSCFLKMKTKSRIWMLYVQILVIFNFVYTQNITTVSDRMRNSSLAAPADQARWNFALRVWRQSTPTDTLAVTSPVLSSLFIAIAQLGSGSDTYNEFMKTQGYPGTTGGNVTDDQLLASWKEEFDELLNCPPYSLFCINAVHLLQKYGNATIKTSFIEKIKTFLNGRLEVEDYNDFMSKITSEEYQRTKPRNERIVGEMSFSSDSFTFLINASFYDQPWKNIFKPEKTINRDFGPDRNNATRLPFMPGEVFTQYYFGDNEDVQILGMPFADGITCMYVFLPLDKNGLAKFELESEGDRLLQMIMKLRLLDVEVEALKFEMESTINLTTGLSRLDIKKALSPQADFSAMTDSKVFMQNMTISTFVRLDEDGFKSKELNPTTKRPVSKMLWQGPHYRFVPYHPFLFIIARNQKHLLYIGRYL